MAHKIFNKNSLITFFIFVNLFFIILRFINIEADFPKGITRSGVLYADEGWYSNNATAYILTGNWYVAGDFNPAVNLLVLPMIQILSFKILGISLVSARLTITIFFILLLVVLYLLIKKYENSLSALITIFLLSTNYTCFAYSRLAILEIPMTFFIVLAIFFALSILKSYRYLFTILSALSFFIALLTKYTAIFALPILLFIFLRGENKNLNRYYHTTIFVAVLGVSFLLYYLFIVHKYPQDYRYFISLNITSRIKFAPVFIIKGIVKAIYHGIHIDKVLYPLIIIYGGILIIQKRLYKSVLSLISLLWIFIYIVMLGIYHYQPPRYYLPLAIPVFIIAAVMLYSCITGIIKQNKILKTVFIMGVLLAVLMNCFMVISYISAPKYSFINMARDIKYYMEESSAHKNILLGDFANTISLATGIFSINDYVGTQDLNFKIEKYQPNFYVSLGPITPEILTVIERYYQIALIKKYDVFDNYLTGEPVYFYKMVQ